jgi:hypothetical protein
MRCATQVSSCDYLSALNESACVCMCLCVCMEVRVYVCVLLTLTVGSVDLVTHSPVRTDISGEHNVRMSVQWTASKVLIDYTDLRQKERKGVGEMEKKMVRERERVRERNK